jgi:hypothetical protein
LKEILALFSAVLPKINLRTNIHNKKRIRSDGLRNISMLFAQNTYWDIGEETEKKIRNKRKGSKYINKYEKKSQVYEK